MSRRQIRVRAVRREQIDLRRLAAALAALAAENARRAEATKGHDMAVRDPRRAA